MSQEIDPKMDVFKDKDPEVKVRTKKMMMWLIIFSLVMLFAGITSAMIVMNGSMTWLKIVPPTGLWISNVVIVLSSITMIIGVKAVKKGNSSLGFTMVFATLVLGLVFTYTQNMGWKQLSAMGMGSSQSTNDKGLTVTSWKSLDRLSGVYGQDYYITFRGEKLEKIDNEYYSPSDTGRLKPLGAEVNGKFNAAAALLAVLIYIHIFHLVFGLIYLVVNLIRLKKGRIDQGNWISLHANGMYWHFMGILWLYLFAFTFYIY